MRYLGQLMLEYYGLHGVTMDPLLGYFQSVKKDSVLLSIS